MRFGIGKNRITPEEVGQDFDVTRERIRQIENKALQKLSIPGEASCCGLLLSVNGSASKQSGVQPVPAPRCRAG